ncbi:MAG: VanZ family protein [Planctomycetes bacterium]|nr:VanZ family protein [Planctomycetota bacterium]
MAHLLRRKLAILSIVIYWPALFVATHIPMPEVIDELDINDKGLHFVAYFSLVFLCWGVIHPYRKVNWRNFNVWLILAVVVWYAVMDEWLQSHVGRHCELDDFLADLCGALASLFVLSWLPFWPATLLLGSMTIFVAANCARTDITQIVPITNNAFHLIAYSTFTGLWLFRLSRTAAKRDRSAGASCHWLILGVALPVFLLTAVKAASFVLDRHFGIADVVFSLVGIGVTLGVALIILSARRRVTPRPERPAPIAPMP